jgi:hypothetical protein
VPQGAVLSPVLANAYLNPLDHQMAERGFQMVRYADDFVILCRTPEEAAAALEEVRQWVEEAGLTLHPDKTHIVDARTESFSFLGYSFRGRFRFPRAKSHRKFVARICELTPRKSGESLEVILQRINRTTQGWFNYFRHCFWNIFQDYDGLIRSRLRRLLLKRHRRNSKRLSRKQRWPNASPARTLMLRNVPKLPPEARVAVWVERISQATTDVCPVRNLYSGDHWSIARDLDGAEVRPRARVRVWVVSAGYELLRLDNRIHAYSATFAVRHPVSPHIPPQEIYRLNHLDKQSLAGLNLEPNREIARALEVSEPVATTNGNRVYFVGGLLDVICNLRFWNRAILTESGRDLWGRRRVQYFVFDRKTKLFAPSKFCAYHPLSLDRPIALPISTPVMTMDLYARLDEGEPRFDGNRAWRHLRDHLGMTLQPLANSPELSAFFEIWLQGAGDAVQVDGRGARVLCPPEWFV